MLTQFVFCHKIHGMKFQILLIAILFCLIGTNPLMSQNTEGAIKLEINPLTGLGSNYVNSLGNWNLLYHTGAIAATYGIIKSGLDRNIHNYFARHKHEINPYTIPAVYIGYVAPVLLGGGLYLGGVLTKNKRTVAAGCAVLQASFIAWSWTSTLKALTGRPNPGTGIFSGGDDPSRKWEFGFMNSGVHYGWPSGHLCVSTAVVSCLASFYNDNPLIQGSGWIVWSYMVFGVIAHDGNTMHWTSDVVAGILMGYSIGSTVGNSFQKFVDGSLSTSNIQIVPAVSNDYFGMLIGIKL